MCDLSVDRLGKLYAELTVSGKLKARGNGPSGLSKTSVRHVHITIHRMLRDAVRWGVLPTNVADLAAMDVPKRTHQTKMATWTPEELRAFLEHVREDEWCALWLLFVTTGMRRGEVAGLRWDALDLDRGRLKIIRARVVVGFKVMESQPKTAKSAREIALDPDTVDVLRSHRKEQSTRRASRSRAALDIDNLVFTRGDGRPIHPESITRRFRLLAEDAGLPQIRLHDLRHSYATAALEAGVPLKVVSERLGHSSIAITGDIYSHVRPEIHQAAADKVAGLILGNAERRHAI
jgi:integrase